jgi:hypothetical protein
MGFFLPEILLYNMVCLLKARVERTLARFIIQHIYLQKWAEATRYGSTLSLTTEE